jgi:hypothetical protein
VKISIVFALALTLVSCFSIGRPVPRDAIAAGDEVVIIGRIATEFEVLGQATPEKGKSTCWVHFCRDKKTDPGMEGNPGDLYLEASFDTDFVMAVPAGIWYLRSVIVRVNDAEFLTLTPTIAVSPQAGDRFAYIGDIAFFMQDDAVRVRVDDRSAAIAAAYGEYLKDGKGIFLAPVARLGTPEPVVKLRVYRQVPTTRSMYINNRWQTTTDWVNVLIMEK